MSDTGSERQVNRWGKRIPARGTGQREEGAQGAKSRSENNASPPRGVPPCFELTSTWDVNARPRSAVLPPWAVF